MKRVFYLYRDLTQLLGKNRAYLKPALFEDALHFASRGLFDHYYGNTEEYRPGKPLPRVAYQVSQAVSDALQPFLRVVYYDRNNPGNGVLPLGTDGRLGLPRDWVHPTSFDVYGATEATQVLDDNEVRATLSSRICPPTLACPMLEALPGGFLRLYPDEADNLTAKYLALPQRPVYAVDYPAGGGAPTYNDERSVDVEWPASRDNQLLTRMLQYPALGLRDAQVQQAAAAMSERGA